MPEAPHWAVLQFQSYDAKGKTRKISCISAVWNFHLPDGTTLVTMHASFFGFEAVVLSIGFALVRRL
jgi:hypothetical protein